MRRFRGSTVGLALLGAGGPPGACSIAMPPTLGFRGARNTRTPAGLPSHPAAMVLFASRRSPRAGLAEREGSPTHIKHHGGVASLTLQCAARPA